MLYELNGVPMVSLRLARPAQPGRNPTLVFITLGEALPNLKRTDEPTKALSYSRAAFKSNDEVDQQHAVALSL